MYRFPTFGNQTRNETPFVGLVEENAGDLRKANPAAISKRKAGLHPPARDSGNRNLDVGIINRMHVWNWAEKSTQASDFSPSRFPIGGSNPSISQPGISWQSWLNALDMWESGTHETNCPNSREREFRLNGRQPICFGSPPGFPSISFLRKTSLMAHVPNKAS